MKSKELTKLAKAAKLSPETIRQLRRRKSLTAQTLVRLLLAIGVKAKDITNLPQKQTASLSHAKIEWNKFGSTLTESEIKEFLSFFKHVKKNWRMK